MNSKFQFISGQGLFYGDDFCVAEFNPEVIKYCVRYDLDTGMIENTFWVAITMLDGTKKEAVEVKSLHKIPYFKIWNCPDCYLSGEKQKLLELKLQQEVSILKEEKNLLCGQGLYLYNEKPIYVFGDEVYKPENTEIRVIIKKNFKIGADEISCAEKPINHMRNYLEFIPEVTEILFYGSLLAVIKPILCQEGYIPDFIIALVGPSGHLKTTLVRKYALWIRDREKQEISFWSNKRINDIIDAIDELSGQNFLVDDLHEAKSSYSAMRQNDRLDTVVRHIGERKKCANIIVTGESMKKMGIFSCQDRMLQVRIPRMNSEQLKELKEKIDSLCPDFMSVLARKFLKKLLENYNTVKNDIKEFFEKEAGYDSDINFDTRTYRHGLYLRLTEVLFRKYCVGNLSEESRSKQLYEALEKNYKIQQKELDSLKQCELDRDYVIDVANMLGAENKYLQSVSCRLEYVPNDENFLVDNGRIYITKIALCNGLIKYYGKVVSIKEVSNALHKVGILEEDSDARTKKLDGKRHYVISKRALELYYNMKNKEN